MNCSKLLDLIFEYSNSEHGSEDSMPLFSQMQIWLHTFLCQDCAEKIKRFETAKEIMHHDFFPFSPGLEDSIMAKIAAEEKETETSVPYAIPGGLSVRGWIIAGLIILISLATAFFGFDFQKIAQETGASFLLPVGITIGIVLTVYGAFFIGSHLKEFSERFGL
ncbi:MAG: peptidoglycan-binding protein [Treponema sp.]|jgi:hypothetical protein|nr:peptidoglycan-binding protein [Treponema sp.]